VLWEFFSPAFLRGLRWRMSFLRFISAFPASWTVRRQRAPAGTSSSMSSCTEAGARTPNPAEAGLYWAKSALSLESWLAGVRVLPARPPLTAAGRTPVFA